MKRLLGTEKEGGRIHRYFMHWGDDGREKITVDTVEDAEVAFNRARQYSQTRHKDLRYVASIPATVVEEICRIESQRWGVSVREAFAEITAAKTDRAKRIWQILTKGRDYSKFQANSYRS